LLSFYGVIGSPSSRYYHTDIAGSITSIGRHLVNKSKDFVEGLGFEVVYMDTDSVLIKIPVSNLDEQIKLGEDLKDKLNVFYKEYLKQFGVVPEDNKIEIKFEKIYEKIIFMGEEGKGTKKRYCAKQTWEEGKKVDKLQFTGIEVVRTDWSKFAQNMQKEAIAFCLGEVDVEVIKKWLLERLKQVRSGVLSKDDLVIWQSLTKPVKEYKTDIPHIKVAKDMIAKGIEVHSGMKIPYILVKGAKKPVPVSPDDYKGGYCVETYWQNKIFPPTERILKATYPRENWGVFFSIGGANSSVFGSLHNFGFV